MGKNKNNLNTKRNKYGSTFLNAVNNNELDTVKLFVNDDKADINQQDEKIFRYSALHIAVANNNLEMVEFLINHKAYINCCDSWQMTPLHIASINKNNEIIKLLIKNGGSWYFKDLLDSSPEDYYCSDEMESFIDQQTDHNIKNT